MRSAKIVVLVGMAAMMAACGPTAWLSSCYNDADLTFDPALLGRWNGSGGDGNLRFQKGDDKSYTVFYTEVDNDGTREESRFEGRLVRLGGVVFLDLLPQPASVNPGAYPFSLAPSQGASLLQSHLAEVGEGLYASLIRAQPASAQNQDDTNDDGPYELHLIQRHWVFRVWLDGDTLRLADLDENWFKGAVNTGKVEIGHDEVNDTLVLTASTPELRAFLLEYGGDGDAFPEPDEGWSRQK